MVEPLIVSGTRITVDLILEKLGSGESIEAVLESHRDRGYRPSKGSRTSNRRSVRQRPMSARSLSRSPA